MEYWTALILSLKILRGRLQAPGPRGRYMSEDSSPDLVNSSCRRRLTAVTVSSSRSCFVRVSFPSLICGLNMNLLDSQRIQYLYSDHFTKDQLKVAPYSHFEEVAEDPLTRSVREERSFSTCRRVNHMPTTKFHVHHPSNINTSLVIITKTIITSSPYSSVNAVHVAHVSRATNVQQKIIEQRRSVLRPLVCRT